MSLCLRAGVPIEAIIDQGKSIRPCIAYTNRTKLRGDTAKGTSCPAAISNALEDLYTKTKERCFVEEEPLINSWQDMEDYALAGFEKAVNKGVREAIKIPSDVAKCPECGETLIHEGGCCCCKICGYSHCG